MAISRLLPCRQAHSGVGGIVRSYTSRPSRTVVICTLLTVLFGATVALGVPHVAAQSSEPASIAISNVTTSTQTPSVGEPFSLRVTITNYEESSQAVLINQLVVDADGERRYVADDLGRLSPGAQTTVTIPLSFDKPGQKNIRLRLYGQSGNNIINTGSPFAVTVRDSQQPSLSVSVPDAVTGGSRDVNVTVGNGVEHPIDSVVITADSPSDEVEFDETKRVYGRMEAGETRTFSFPARVTTAGRYPVNVSLAYTDDGTRRQLTERFETRFGEPSNAGRVILSGVEATQRGETLEISATASNVGGTEVGGVVVSVPGDETVRPQTYFVGSIEGSGFSTFTLRTTTTDRVQTIPVEVTYVTGGVERSAVTDVRVDSPPTPAPSRDRGGGSFLSLGRIATVAVGLVLLVGVGLLYRRRT